VRSLEIVILETEKYTLMNNSSIENSGKKLKKRKNLDDNEGGDLGRQVLSELVFRSEFVLESVKTSCIYDTDGFIDEVLLILYIYVYTFMYTYLLIYFYACILIYFYVYILTNILLYVFMIPMDLSMRFTYIYIHTDIYIYLYIYIYTCYHIYTYISSTLLFLLRLYLSMHTQVYIPLYISFHIMNIYLYDIS
jgi:hypothetical protein